MNRVVIMPEKIWEDHYKIISFCTNLKEAVNWQKVEILNDNSVTRRSNIEKLAMYIYYKVDGVIKIELKPYVISVTFGLAFEPKYIKEGVIQLMCEHLFEKEAFEQFEEKEFIEKCSEKEFIGKM